MVTLLHGFLLELVGFWIKKKSTPFAAKMAAEAAAKVCMENGMKTVRSCR